MGSGWNLFALAVRDGGLLLALDSIRAFGL
jgi:hypothetical protein